MYPCQKKVAKMLIAGDWIINLKARRLGITWELAAYCLWLMMFFIERDCFAVNQTFPYAKDFIKRVKYIRRHLPDELKPKIAVDNKEELMFENGSTLKAIAPTENNIHSVAGDFILFDEASRIKFLQEMLAAAQPAVETAKGGQIVIVSTSAGHGGEFHEQWKLSAAGKTRYKSVFFPWSEHPKRDAAWYEKERKENEANPLYMKQQYPETPEEAFEFAEGRVYPQFTAPSIEGVFTGPFIKVYPTLSPLWKKYRSLDWGGTDAFVCLWGCVIPGDPAMLTIDPSCVNLINELLSYGYDEHGKPKDEFNHACDSLRYMVTTPGNNGITGHLHIYREIYVENAVEKNYSLSNLKDWIVNLSGAETYDLNIGDRSRNDLINQFRGEWGFEPMRGQKALRGGEKLGEIVQGIVHVNELMIGTRKNGANQFVVGLPERKAPPTDAIKGFF